MILRSSRSMITLVAVLACLAGPLVPVDGREGTPLEAGPEAPEEECTREPGFDVQWADPNGGLGDSVIEATLLPSLPAGVETYDDGQNPGFVVTPDDDFRYLYESTPIGFYSNFELTDGVTTLTVPDGILLTTGYVGDLLTACNKFPNGWANSYTTSDPDLAGLYAQPGGPLIYNAASIEWKFTSTSHLVIRLRAVFASEEFTYWAEPMAVPADTSQQSGICAFPDVFGVFFNYQNKAIVPATDAQGQPYEAIVGVSRDVIHFNNNTSGVGFWADYGVWIDNEPWTLDNKCQSLLNPNDYVEVDWSAEYDGWSEELTFSIPVQPTEPQAWHTLKLAIADVKDWELDSGVFIQPLEVLLDSDGDGVPDVDDDCADTPACADPVDEDGCPFDTDGDGVVDGCDLCENTPACARPVNAYGCPLDTDGDGVWDGCDECPDTPACASSVNDVGCPADSDGDGVPDGCDECPGTPSCATVNAVGCPSDGDEDGVFDGCDQCPETMPSWRDYVNTDGCACNDPNQDIEPDGDVDLTDFGRFQICFNGPNQPPVLPDRCYCSDDDGDGDVDLADFSVFQQCFNGPNQPHRCPDGGAGAPEGGGFAMSSLFGSSLLDSVDVTFTLDSDQSGQTISAGTAVDWIASVEVTGSNQGLAGFFFDVELREDSATGPLANITIDTSVWADSFAVAGPAGRPKTGAAITASGSAGGPGMNTLSSSGFNTTPGLLTQVGAAYLSWDPWQESNKEWVGSATWGIGLDARKEALLLDAYGSYSLVTGTIDTSSLDPGDYVLRLVPAANISVLQSSIDLNSPAIGGISEPANSVSEPITIEFTIGAE